MTATQKELIDVLESFGRSENAPSVTETETVSVEDNLPVLDVPGQAISNLGPSALKFGGDILQTVLDPIGTAENIYDLGKGLFQLMTPGVQPEEAKAKAVGQFFADRYGGWENIKKTVATDPVGFLADFSAITTGGSAALARAPALAGSIGKKIQTAASAVDPINIAAKTIGAVGSKVAAPVAGQLTGIGGDAFIIANEAARAGGAKAQAFLDNLRGRGSDRLSQTLDLAKDALLELKQARQTAYLDGMLPIKASNKTLKFDDIDNAMGDLATSGSYKGIAIRGSKPQETFQAIQAKIDEFKNLGPENHRAVDFDQMKQAIGEIRDGINVVDSPAAYNLANTIYGKIRQTIVNQDKGYSKVMAEYMDASDLIADIEKTFALKGRKTNIDTSIRKLQSIMRNNVDTSYGRRAELGGKLSETAAGQTLLPALAGQAAAPWTSRGIGIPSKAILTGAAATLNPAVLFSYPLTMPRVMGEAAYYLGKGGPALRAAGRGAPAAFQAGRAERIANEDQSDDALVRALQRMTPR
jgi:hypothetical protein